MNALQAAFAHQQAQKSVPKSSSSKITSQSQDGNEISACFERLSLSGRTGLVQERYNYEVFENPGAQIRLLILEPAKNINDPVRCVLQVVTLEEAETLNFDALSYTWGDENQRKLIQISGVEVSVTLNLQEALVHLRDEQKYQRLWVDAVCIDQANVGEKNYQILLMQQIYYSATKVVIWLGPSDAELDPLLLKLIDIDKNNDERQQTGILSKMFTTADEFDETLRAFLKLFRKPWFSRVWVVQEYLLARNNVTAVCGHHRLPWSVINTAMTAADWIRQDTRNAVQRQLQAVTSNTLAGTMSFTFRIKRQLDFGQVLHFTSGKQATEPKDKIYALMGLVSERVRQMLSPDYGQPLHRVYQKAMVVVCQEYMVLTPLCAAAEVKSRPELGLPSWCLDFSNTQWQAPFNELQEYPFIATQAAHGACGMGKAAIPGSLVYDEEKGLIMVEGTIIGILEETLATTYTTLSRKYVEIENLSVGREDSTYELDMAEIKSGIVLKFLQDVDRASNLVHSVLCDRFGQEVADARLASGAIWKTFARDQLLQALTKVRASNGLKTPSNYSLFQSFLQESPRTSFDYVWASNLSADVRAQEASLNSRIATEKCIIKTCLAMARAIPDRTFVMTDTGYMGLAGADVKTGDVLCIIFGCVKPLVLRPDGVDESGRPVYRLVAFAYVQGIMKGGFFKENPRFERQQFVLR